LNVEVLVVANAFPSRTAQGADAAAARVRALAAWKNFLSLWKDADPDILIPKEAKAEYAKLQSQWKVPPPRLLVDYGLRNRRLHALRKAAFFRRELYSTRGPDPAVFETRDLFPRGLSPAARFLVDRMTQLR